MKNNIQVKLTFQADTGAAKKQIGELQQTLSNLAVTPVTGVGTKMTQELQQATNKAVELKIALHNATNVDTGKLNLNKFNQQLKNSKMTLTEYANELAKLGPQGTQAFLQLTNSIRQAETPLIALTGKMKAFATTMMNTLRWQVSSSMITGTISAFSSIIDYSKELNESLNNIRIVTGKNIDSMSKFASEANKAAKALSASTTEYTNASLIYYQQGLSDKAVKERTETTLKLANVTGENAEKVSQWMTAIWNNFDDGSKKLEYYADVLAKLGAATASSADEIAGGIEKFSAVADTVGLSYEYAASALATITAETRQSEEVVGTALKTIFARVENLKLGETLEDGTSLGQYSDALLKIGVNINDANGNLKQMDNILNEIGSKWEMLNKNEQVALAQSVAGIRQYNQFIALMDNWDIMEKNIKLSKDSTGELEQQQKIYEQGLEGSTKRVQATLEEIKNTLLDENDLIPLLETANDFLGVVQDLLDAFGGLPTILAAVATILTKIFSTQIASGLVNAGNFFKSAALTVVGKGDNLKNNMVQEATTAGANITANSDGYSGLQQSHNVKANFEDQQNLQDMHGKVNSAAEQYVKMLYEAVQYRRELAQKAAEEADNTDNILNNTTKDTQDKIEGNERRAQFGEKVAELKDSATQHYLMNSAEQKMETQSNLGQQGRFSSIFKNELADLKTHGNLSSEQAQALSSTTAHGSLGNKTLTGAMRDLENVETEMDSLSRDKEEYDRLNAKKTSGKKLSSKETKKMSQLDKDGMFSKKDVDGLTKYDQKMNGLVKTQKKYVNGIQSVIKRQDQFSTKTSELTNEYKDLGEETGKVIEEAKNHGKAITNLANAQREEEEATKNANTERQNAIAAGKGFTESMVEGFSAVAQTGMGLQMLISSFDSLTTAIAEGDVSFSTILGSMTSMLMSLPMLINGLKALNDVTKIGVVWEKVKIGLDKIREKMIAKKIALNEAEAASDEKKSKRSLKASITKALGSVAEWLGKGPAGWIIAAASLAAIAAIGIGMVKAKVSAKAQEDNAEQATETATKTNEEAEKNSELIDSYNDLLKKYEETGEGREELATKAQEIAKAYNIEGAAVAALTGDYSKLTKAINEARVKELDKVIEDNDNAKAANSYKLKASFKKGNGMESNGGYGVEFSDSGKGGANNAAMVRIAKQYVANNPELSDIVWFGDAGSGDIYFNIDDIDDPDQLMALYEAVEGATKEARAQDVDGEVYNDMMEWLSKSKEDYESMKKLKDASTKASAEKKIITTKVNGKSYNEITNYGDYATYKENVLSQAESEAEREAILAELFSNEATAKMEQISQVAEAQAQKGKDFATKWITSLYANASEAWISAYASIDATGLTQEEFLDRAKEAYIKALQAEKHETAKALGIETDAADLFTSMLQGSNGALAEHADLAELATKNILIMSKALDKATKAWQNNKEILLSANKNTTAYAIALDDMSDELKGIFNIENKDISLSRFINSNLEAVSKFFSGDDSVINEFRKGIAQTVDELYIDFDFSSIIDTTEALEAQVGVDIEFNKEDLEKAYQTNAAAVQEYLDTLGLGLDIVNGKIERVYKITDNSPIEAQLKEYKKELEDSLKLLEEEIDLYYELNTAIETSTRKLNKYKEAADRAFGSDKFKYLDAAEKEYDVLIEKQKQLNEEMKTNILKGDTRDRLLDLGFSFNDDGSFSNYNDRMEILYEQYKKAHLSGNDKAADEWEKAIKDAEKYRSDLDNYIDGIDQLEQYGYEQASARLETAVMEVELNFEISERSLEQIEWQLSQLEDTPFEVAASVKLLTSKSDIAKSNIDNAEKGIQSVLGDIGLTEKQVDQFIGGDTSVLDGITMSAEQAEKLGEYTNSLRENLDLYKETADLIETKLVDAYSAWNDEASVTVDLMSQQQSLLESYKNIVDIVGKDRLGIDNEFLDNLAKANNEIAQSTLKANREIYETNKTAYEQAVAAGIDSEKLKELETQMLDSQQTYMDSWSSALEAAASEFESSVERIMEAHNKALGDLNEKSQQFEKQQTLQDFFLKDYEKTYEISKLNRQIIQSIDSTDSAAAASKLRDVQAELLDYQKDGKKMSDYDLQYLQKKYDLTLAQNALEDAQNAKSTARLTRDSQGNFGYVYTANQKNVESAQQQYEDKLYAMEQFMDQSVNDLSKQWFELNQQWADEMTALDKNAEDYEEKAAQITAYYTGLMENVSGEMTDMVQYGMEINQEYGTHAAETFQETILGKMYTDYTTFEELQVEVSLAMQNTMDQLNEKHKEYEGVVDTTMENAGTSTNEFKDTFNTALGEAQKKVGALESDIANMKTKFATGFTEAVGVAQTFKTQFNQELDGVDRRVTSLSQKINNFLNAYASLPSDGEIPSFDPSGMGGKGNNDGGLDIPNDNNNGSNLPNEPTITSYSMASTDMTESDVKETYGDGNYITIDNERQGRTEYWIRTNALTASQVSNSSYHKTESDIDNYTNEVKWKYYNNWQDSFRAGNPITIGSGSYDSKFYEADRTWSYVGGWKIDDYFTSGDKIYYSDEGKNNKGVNVWKVYRENDTTPYFLDTQQINNLFDKKGATWVQKYDTGGYTGSWGPEGRMAMLHQKEIVLNAHDTENFLTAIEIVRSIADKLDTNVKLTAQGLGGMVAAAGYNNTREVLEQNVTIHAEFPNATNHDEIEMAFSDLINQASQYVNRR